MTDDRIYPATKPATNGTTTAPAANPSFPPTKAQLYGTNRPAYRPQPYNRRSNRHSRGCCCRCCCWTTFLLLLLILLAAAAAAVIYLIYRPQRPTFAVSSLKVSTLNLTSSNHLTTSISVNVTARNPNKKVIYIYDPTTINVSTNDEVGIGQGSYPSFEQGTESTTLLKASVVGPDNDLDDVTAGKVRGYLKSKKGLELKIELDTKVTVKMGAMKTPKAGIRVSCEGIKVDVPTGKKATTAATGNVKCKVDLRFKIWKFTF